MTGDRRVGLVLLALQGLAACVGSDLVECPSGVVCPAGDVCAPAGDRCVAEAQIAACGGRSEGDACGYLGVPGTCATGLCDIAASSPYTLHVALPGSGAGRVVSDPPGIDCGATCAATFPVGTRVVLTATPLASSSFVGWSDPCSGSGGCEVTISRDTTVSASFVLPPAPAISGVEPEQGTGVGGAVVILGAGFTGATLLTFNGVEQPRYTVVAPGRIETTVPAGARSGPIRVTTPGGTGSLDRFPVVLADIDSVTFTGTAGCIDVAVVVSQERSRPADVRVEIDPGTGSFRLATAVDGGDGLLGVDTSPAGVAHTFRWSSTSDLPHVTAGGVKVRVSAAVAGVTGSGGRSVTRTLTVTNGPSFAAAKDHDADASGYWWARGDLDGDGHLDVITGSFGWTGTILFGDGRGGFLPAVPLPFEESTELGQLADVNGDGALDLLSTAGQRELTVRLGYGDGTFTQKGRPIADNVFWFEVVDLDGDGKLDVLFPGFSFDLESARGKGDGTFEAPVSHAAFGTAYRPSVGDVDGDGLPDVVTMKLNDSGSESAAATILGDGAGGFRAGPETPLPGRPLASWLGDLDGDGNLDLLVPAGAGMAIHHGDGTGAFGAATPLLELSHLYGVALGDVSADGKPDVVVLGAAQLPAILIADGSGAPQGSSVLPAGFGLLDVALADLDHDGRTDVLVLHTGGVLVLRNVTARACAASP